MLIGSDGTPRRLTANDLEGTSITLGAIRAMLARRFGGRGAAAAAAARDDDDEDVEMASDDDDDDDDADWWGSVCSLMPARWASAR